MAKKSSKKSIGGGAAVASVELVNASEMERVVNAAGSVAAPAGAGLGSSAAGGAGLGLSAAAGGNGVGLVHDNSGAPAGGAAVRSAAGRSDAASQTESASIIEDVKVAELTAKIKTYFDVPEWSGAAALRAQLLPLVDSGVMSSEQFDAVVAAAARKAGVVAPLVSVARVLVVVRAHYRKEFENIVGRSLDVVRCWLRAGVVVPAVYSVRVPLSLVRVGASVSEHLYIEPLAAGASASAVVRALLSLRFFVAFRSSLAGAVAGARSEYRGSVENSVRKAISLGLSVDDVCELVRSLFVSVPASDVEDRKRLTNSLASRVAAVNSINDAILLAGGAAFLEKGCLTISETKRAAKVRKLIAKRERLQSVCATLSGLLAG